MVYKNIRKKIIAMLFGMFLFTLSNDVFAEKWVKCERALTLNNSGEQAYLGQGGPRITGYLFWLYMDSINAVLIYLSSKDKDYYKETWSFATSLAHVIGGGRIDIDDENFKKDVRYVSPDVPSKQLLRGLYFWKKDTEFNRLDFDKLGKRGKLKWAKRATLRSHYDDIGFRYLAAKARDVRGNRQGFIKIEDDGLTDHPKYFNEKQYLWIFSAKEVDYKKHPWENYEDILKLDEQNEEECPICLEEGVLTTENCLECSNEHRICLTCANQLQQRICPFCRVPYDN